MSSTKGRNADAGQDLRRILVWIVAAATLMVALALGYLRLVGGLTLHTVIATVLGVFLAVVLGCGLMAWAFFSNKSGHDEKAGGIGQSSQTFHSDIHGLHAAKLGSQQDGADPSRLEDRVSEIARPGSHGGGGSPAWRS